MDILERMPWLAKDAVFQRLASIAEVAALSKEDREKYDESLRKYRDTISVMEGQFQEGREKGLVEGEAIGIAKGEAIGQAKAEAKARQEKLESARSLKENGVPIELIASSLGLSPEEINAL